MEELFGISKTQLKKILTQALSRGGDHADIFFEYRATSFIKMEENIIKTTSYSISSGAGIRVIDGEQIGYSYTEDITFDNLKEAASAASYIATNKKENLIAPIQRTRKRNLYSVSTYSIEEPISRKTDLIETVNKTARGYDSKISQVTVTFSEELRKILYVDAEGKFFEDIQPLVLLTCYCIADDGKTRQGAGVATGGRSGLEFYEIDENSPTEIATEAAHIAVTNLDARPAPAGSLAVVLGPGESGILLHEAVGHGLEADFARKKLSNYSDKIGEKVASEHCTVIDSGLIPGLRGSINIDDEGTLPEETIMIENGVLRGYMHDILSARIMDMHATGNGRRESFKYPPMPRMTNIFMKPGNYDPEEIISSVKFGIYAKRFAGGQVNIVNGDFTFGVSEAYLIENGKITAPLKDVTLIGNGPDILRKVEMVANDLKFSRGGWTCGKNDQRVPVGIGMPTVKVSEITVGGTKL